MGSSVSFTCIDQSKGRLVVRQLKTLRMVQKKLYRTTLKMSLVTNCHLFLSLKMYKTFSSRSVQSFILFRAFLLQINIRAYDSKQHKNVYLTLQSINCCEINRKKPSSYVGMELYSITWHQAKVSHFTFSSSSPVSKQSTV